MSQNDLVISNQTFPLTRSDINSALQALGSTNSGTTEPATTYANMFWYDTTTQILKIRSEADDAWSSIGYVDQSSNEFKILDDTIVATTAGVTAGLLGDQATATWETGTGTTESLVSPAKVKASILANAPAQSTALGAVGTYAFLRNTGVNVVEGSSYSGFLYGGVTRSGGNNISPTTGATASGTWRAMGNTNGGFSNDKFTVFVRIS